MAIFSEISKDLKKTDASKKRTRNKIKKHKQAKQEAQESSEFRWIELQSICPDPAQPRKIIETESADLCQLADTIRDKGVLEPLLVRKHDTGYMVVSGERRFHASKLAGITQVPCRIVEFSETEIAEVQLIENIQRKDLNPLERARALANLQEATKEGAQSIFKRLGISKSLYYGLLSLLKLPTDIIDVLDKACADSTIQQIPLRELIELARKGTAAEKRKKIEQLLGGKSLVRKPKATTIKTKSAAHVLGHNERIWKSYSENPRFHLHISIPSNSRVSDKDIDIEELDAIWQEFISTIISEKKKS